LTYSIDIFGQSPDDALHDWDLFPYGAEK